MSKSTKVLLLYGFVSCTGTVLP